MIKIMEQFVNTSKDRHWNYFQGLPVWLWEQRRKCKGPAVTDFLCSSLPSDPKLHKENHTKLLVLITLASAIAPGTWSTYNTHSAEEGARKEQHLKHGRDSILGKQQRY